MASAPTPRLRPLSSAELAEATGALAGAMTAAAPGNDRNHVVDRCQLAEDCRGNFLNVSSQDLSALRDLNEEVGVQFLPVE